MEKKAQLAFQKRAIFIGAASEGLITLKGVLIIHSCFCLTLRTMFNSSLGGWIQVLNSIFFYKIQLLYLLIYFSYCFIYLGCLYVFFFLSFVCFVSPYLVMVSHYDFYYLLVLVQKKLIKLATMKLR